MPGRLHGKSLLKAGLLNKIFLTACESLRAGKDSHLSRNKMFLAWFESLRARKDSHLSGNKIFLSEL